IAAGNWSRLAGIDQTAGMVNLTARPRFGRVDCFGLAGLPDRRDREPPAHGRRADLRSPLCPIHARGHRRALCDGPPSLAASAVDHSLSRAVVWPIAGPRAALPGPCASAYCSVIAGPSRGPADSPASDSPATLPPFPTQQHMDTTIAVAHAGGGDLLDTFTQMSLPGST